MENANWAEVNVHFPVRASVFEFRYRDIIIRLIYLASFLCYLLDPEMVGSILAGMLAEQSGQLTVRAWTHLVLLAGTTLVFCAVLIRTWATAYMGWNVMRNPRLHTDRLITAGPFGYMRNPLYLGNLLMVAGVSVMFSRTGMVLLVAGNLLLIYRLVLLEESQLGRTHGPSFQAYCRAVPRWIPLLKPRVQALDYSPSFKHGILGELLLWIILIAVAVYAVTLDLRLFSLVFVCAFIPGACRRIHRLLQSRIRVVRAAVR